jgi:hypothetical protein
VHDVLFVQEFQRKQCLVNNLASFLLSKCLRLQNLVKIASHQELLNDEEVRDVLKDIVHAHNVRVFRVHQNFELIDKKVVNSWLL